MPWPCLMPSHDTTAATLLHFIPLERGIELEHWLALDIVSLVNNLAVIDFNADTMLESIHPLAVVMSAVIFPVHPTLSVPATNLKVCM